MAYPVIVILWREGKDCDEEEYEELQCGSDAVVQEVGDAPEDAPCNHDCIHNGVQSRLRQDNIC